jgi:hypothetical protein
MRKTAFATLAVIGAITLTAAQERLNLAGTWQMDKARSQYPAEAAIEVIHQHGGAFDISLTEKWPGRSSAPMQIIHLTTDGKPAVNKIAGNKFTSTTHWEHGKLVTFVEGDRGQHMTEVRELSSDGHTLTVTGYHQDDLTKPYYVRVMVRRRVARV